MALFHMLIKPGLGVLPGIGDTPPPASGVSAPLSPTPRPEMEMGCKAS